MKYPIVNGQKQCSKCLVTKPIADFYKKGNGWTGYCKPCTCQRVATYEARPEKTVMRANTKRQYAERNKALTALIQQARRRLRKT